MAKPPKKDVAAIANARANIQKIYDKAAHVYQVVLRGEVLIDWELTDIYGQPLYKKTVKGSSGGFSLSEDHEEQVILCLDDAISASSIEFTNEKEVRNLMNKEEENEIIFDYITLTNKPLQKPLNKQWAQQ